jgi:HK97 family phage major capsid protein
MKKQFMTLATLLTTKMLSFDAFEKMDDAQKASLHKEVSDNNAEYFKELESLAGESFKAAIEELKSKDLEAIKTEIVSLESKIMAKLEEPKNAAPLSFESAIEKTIMDNKEQIEKFADDNKKIVLKTPVTVGTNNTINGDGSASHYLTTTFTGVISTLRKRILTYLSYVSVGTISTQHAMWVEELDEQGNPTFLAEGGTKSQVSVRYEEREMKTKKVAAWVKVTKEMLRDLPQLISYIQANLIRRIDIITENGLFGGDGLSNNLKGLATYAVAFTGGGLKTAKPSNVDVFRALALQVEKAFGTANVVYVRPEVLAAMDVEKSDDSGNYLIPPFKDGTNVAGIRLVPSMGLPSGLDFIGGDLTVVQVRFREGMSIEMDRTGDDFTKNLYTILAEQELVQFVSANDTQLLVKGDMATAIAAITAS